MDIDTGFFLPRPWLTVDARAVLRDEAPDGGGEAMARNEALYVKGTIRRPGREAVQLGYWHRVVMNGETNARAMRRVAFID